MLDALMTDLVAEYNVGKISRKGKIRAIFREEGPTLYRVDVNGIFFPGYLLHFLFDSKSLIHYAGHSRNFPKKAFDQYSLGAFSVAIDMEYLAKLAKKGMDFTQIKEERIIKFSCDYSKLKPCLKEKVQRRLQATMEKYNTIYGFDLDYNGFTLDTF